jgi:hypothetical protein
MMLVMATRRYSPDQLQPLEPNLNTSAVGAVHIPGELSLIRGSIRLPGRSRSRKWRSHFFTNFGMDPEASSLMENCGGDSKRRRMPMVLLVLPNSI